MKQVLFLCLRRQRTDILAFLATCLQHRRSVFFRGGRVNLSARRRGFALWFRYCLTNARLFRVKTFRRRRYFVLPFAV